MEVNIADNRVYFNVHFKVKNKNSSHPLSHLAHLINKQKEEIYGNVIL
jgi:hypothetical protein